MSSDWLLWVQATSDAPAEAVARVHESLRRTPPAVLAPLRDRRVGVAVYRDWDSWDDHPNAEHRYADALPWGRTPACWDAETRSALVNAKLCPSQPLSDGSLIHELGHALADLVFDRPHMRPEFRAAWTAGRKRVKERWPDDYRRGVRMGVYTPVWQRGCQEVWAESVPWIVGARADIHPAFGETFAECVALVRAEIGALDREAAA